MKLRRQLRAAKAERDALRAEVEPLRNSYSRKWSKTVPSTEGGTSAGSSIKLSTSHLFFLICAATVASTFPTY
ncbi:hypothetical protein CFP56_036318 [Quercus suber]|uniref:Uncharacterized protein n=1 Tax=Quercus suber TaxID=58331 RepID=A0AAW0J7I3_QUESU